jgi:hypothetical protein
MPSTVKVGGSLTAYESRSRVKVLQSPAHIYICISLVLREYLKTFFTPYPYYGGFDMHCSIFIYDFFVVLTSQVKIKKTLLSCLLFV